ncbi:MAG: 2,3-bisphosphoglycerate-independent phosphoglycerate mutase [Patescibacteria group bacterium]|nr:2,3-bisphosphoglycerate-independent phosphoglycerate mutase [Patescibacteria group bacterium]
MSKRTLVLAVLDGWGIGKMSRVNAIYAAQPENFNRIRHTYPGGTLQASGIAIGLPWGEEGNSEVGHITLGAGKVIYQHYPRISLAIKDGSFYKNEVLLKAFSQSAINRTAVNIIGLLTEANVHASLEHLTALLDLAKAQNAAKVNIHLFTDGRDGPLKGGADLLAKVGNQIQSFPAAKISSLSGRYFGMDRDSHLDRTKAAYDAIVGNIKPSSDLNPVRYADLSYARGTTDEYLTPALFDADRAAKPGDSFIFFNFREDRMRQITEMFLKNWPPGSYFCSFTEYNPQFQIPAAFPQEKITNPLGRVLSDNRLVQLRLAETEKYAHVTYFFNGLREEPFPNEYRVLIPSISLARPDEHPEMRAEEITARAVSALTEEKIYDFLLINYANPDIIAHTGNYDATVAAIKEVDKQIGTLSQAVLANNGILIVTADHGNAETLIDPQTGLPETKHNPSPVPFYVIVRGWERNKTEEQAAAIEGESIGVLSDVAPTILELMGIPKPAEMTGVSLIRDLR